MNVARSYPCQFCESNLDVCGHVLALIESGGEKYRAQAARDSRRRYVPYAFLEVVHGARWTLMPVGPADPQLIVAPGYALLCPACAEARRGDG